MGFNVSLQKRLQQLKKAKADLDGLLYETAKKATMRAVEAATDATPPKKGTDSLKGTNTRTGELKAHWATDSKVEPVGGAPGGSYNTILANDIEYASYVDQGHRMDRHFVPGLYVDENGMLDYDPDYGAGGGGLVVGTKTRYVKGEFMADKGKEAYKKTILAELDKNIRRIFA